MNQDLASITCEIKGRWASIVIDRPPLNILTGALLDELSGALDELAQLPSLQLLTLRGAGERAFSTGVAVEDHTRDRIEQSLQQFHEVLRKLAALPALSIAVVQGYCLGGGMELAASCDFVLATRDSTFGQPEIELGCFPPAAAALYPSRIGHSKTLELLATGRRLDGEEALEAGFATWIADTSELETVLDERASAILDKSAAVTRALKSALYEGHRRLFEYELARTERAYLDDLLKSEDMDEGLAAFFEKRRPTWKHK